METGRCIAGTAPKSTNEFSLGGVRFEIYHTPGETPDHLTVWIPQYRAAFTGDNYYESFPNLYTLRGTRPRWALEYIASLNQVLALKPEIVLPSHGPVIRGGEEVAKRLTRYRDAIQYVHDEVVKGMDAGKDVFTLMREVHLPPDLDVGESYGKLTWSVRGIYEGYAGWFDLDPATMYETPAAAVYPDVVRLAGGPDAVSRLALEKIEKGDAVEALHLTAMALAADPKNRPALEARLKALADLAQPLPQQQRARLARSQPQRNQSPAERRPVSQGARASRPHVAYQRGLRGRPRRPRSQSPQI